MWPDLAHAGIRPLALLIRTVPFISVSEINVALAAESWLSSFTASERSYFS